MARHGAEQHIIRADGVYITSVLQPTTQGYDPVGDAQATAARFVAPMGLAGPVGYSHRGGSVRILRGSVNLLGAPGASIRERWLAFKARVKANVAANRLVRDMRAAAQGPVTAVVGPTAANAAEPVTAPPGQTRASAAAVVGLSARAGDPPAAGPVATATAMAPGQAAWPANFWQSVMQRGMHPVVAQAAGSNALAKWFGVKSPTGEGY